MNSLKIASIKFCPSKGSRFYKMEMVDFLFATLIRKSMLRTDSIDRRAFLLILGKIRQRLF